MPESPKDEERAENTGRKSEQRGRLCQRVQGMQRMQQTQVGGLNREGGSARECKI